MADTTTPDNIYIHTNSDPQSLPVAGAALATSVQEALNKRQVHTYKWANAIEREVAIDMTEGDLGDQADTDTLYRYSGATWQPLISPSQPYPVAVSGIESLGNGRVEATYARLGDQITVVGSITIGSTTTFNDDFFRITLPVDRDPKYDVGRLQHAVGACNFINPGVWESPGTVTVNATSPNAASFQAHRTLSGTEYIGTWRAAHNVPIAFADGSMITWQLTYQAAAGE